MPQEMSNINPYFAREKLQIRQVALFCCLLSSRRVDQSSHKEYSPRMVPNATSHMLINQFFSEAPEIPRVSSVLVEMAKPPSVESIDIHRLKELVGMEQSIAAKVLRWANASSFGQSDPVTDISRAVDIVGVRSIFALSLTESVLKNQYSELLDMPIYWRHAHATAQICSAVCTAAQVPSNGAYISGLLHGIGTLLIHQKTPGISEKIIKKVGVLDMPARAMLEREMIGIDHAQVSAEIIRRWHLPNQISSIVSAYPLITRVSSGVPRALFFSSVMACAGLRGESIERKFDNLAHLIPKYAAFKKTLVPEVIKIIENVIANKLLDGDL